MPNRSEITHLFYCKLCVADVPHDVPLKEYATTETGMTEQGFQVWCKRHKCNIVKIELNGSSWTWDDSTNLGITHAAGQYKQLVT